VGKAIVSIVCCFFDVLENNSGVASCVLDYDDSDDSIGYSFHIVRIRRNTTMGRFRTALSKRKGKAKKRITYGRTIKYNAIEIDRRRIIETTKLN